MRNDASSHRRGQHPDGVRPGDGVGQEGLGVELVRCSTSTPRLRPAGSRTSTMNVSSRLGVSIATRSRAPVGGEHQRVLEAGTGDVTETGIGHMAVGHEAAVPEHPVVGVEPTSTRRRHRGGRSGGGGHHARAGHHRAHGQSGPRFLRGPGRDVVGAEGAPSSAGSGSVLASAASNCGLADAGISPVAGPVVSKTSAPMAAASTMGTPMRAARPGFVLRWGVGWSVSGAMVPCMVGEVRHHRVQGLAQARCHRDNGSLPEAEPKLSDARHAPAARSAAASSARSPMASTTSSVWARPGNRTS